MMLSNVIQNRPEKVNTRYWGSLKLTVEERRNGKEIKKSLDGVIGRAWQNDVSGDRWFFQPHGTPTTDENIYIVFTDSLIG